jgi:sulfate adenylyltransferase subunit 2
VKLGLELIVRNVQDAIDEGKVVEETGILAEIVFKPLRFWMLLSLSLMLALEVLVGMKKSKSKRTHLLFRMILVSGMKRTNVLLFDILNGKIENGQNVRVFL